MSRRQRGFARKAEQIATLRAEYESAPKLTFQEFYRVASKALKPTKEEAARKKQAKKKRKPRGLAPGMRRSKENDRGRATFVDQVLKNIQSRSKSGAPAPATQTGSLGWRPSSHPSSTGHAVSSREPLGEARKPQASSEAARSEQSNVPGPPEDRSSLGQTGVVDGEAEGLTNRSDEA